MKKQLISALLALTVTISMGSFVFAQESKTLDSIPQLPITQTTDAEPHFQTGDAPAHSPLMESMTPPVTALVMCMLEQDITYNDEDAVFFWNGLYYMLSFYGQMDERAEFTDEKMTLPSEAVADYAAALFANFNGLPEIPAELADRIQYHPETDTYETQRGDMGLAQVLMHSADLQADGTFLVRGSVVYTVDNTDLAQFEAVLSETNRMFGYAINGLTVTI